MSSGGSGIRWMSTVSGMYVRVMDLNLQILHVKKEIVKFLVTM